MSKIEKEPYQSSWGDLYTFLLIAMSLEDFLGIEIKDEEWGKISDIQDIIDLINSKELKFKYEKNREIN